MTRWGTTALALADAVLGITSGDALITVTRECSLLSRFARSTPTQATRIDDLTVHVLALRDGFTGAAETNAADPAALRDAVRRAEAGAAAARRAGGRAEHPGLPLPGAGPVPAGRDGFDAATAALDPLTAGAALSAAFAATAERGAQAFGVWTAGHVTTAVASSSGVRRCEDVTDVYLKVIARDARTGRSGWAAGAGAAVADLDPERIARRAAAKLTRAEPVAIEPGSYPVVLEADAIGALLGELGAAAFNGLAHAEGRGALVGRLGTHVAAPSITLLDDPEHPLTLPRHFDAEGVAKGPSTLVDAGVARAVVHDTRSAALAGGGVASSGHARAPGGSPFGPAPTNLVLAAGAAADEAELCSTIERGLYVTRFWYLNMVHERSALLTGTSRDGTFLIEDGVISRPALDVRFTDSPLRLLAATEALGREQSLVCEAEFYERRFASGQVVAPLRADGFRVTGRTRA